MGQCISRNTDVGDKTRSNNSALGKGVNTSISRRKKKLTKSSYTVNAGNVVTVEMSKSTDSSDSGHRASKSGVVVIPDVSQTSQEDSEEILQRKQNGAAVFFNLFSPSYTEATTCSTPAISERSVASLTACPESIDHVRKDLTAAKFENPIAINLSTASPLEIDSNNLSLAWKNDSNPQDDAMDDSTPKIIIAKRSRIKNFIREDCMHPVTRELDGTVSASFTPIKQTSLQSKVSVIQEEDVAEAPSDEESLHDKVLTRRMQRELNTNGRVPGPLTPIKLRTQWKTTSSSIQVREPATWLQSKQTSSPLRNGSADLPNHEKITKQLNESVDESLLYNFQKLKLKVAVAAQEEKRNQKVAKLEDRIKDVQGYRELWGEFQQIQEQLSEDKHERKPQSNNIANDGRHEVEYDFEEDTLPTGTNRKRRACTRSRNSVEKETSTCSDLYQNSTSLSTSFDAEVKQTWIFDFEAEGFDDKRKCEDDESSQGSLSLLSEKSMEAQRRFYTEKRKDRKRKKKLEKEGIFVSRTPTMPRSVTRQGSVDSVSVATSHGDYGPASRLRRSTRSVDRYTTDSLPENSTAITDMELSIGITRFGSSKNAIADSDNHSMVSYLSDDQSFSGSVASVFSRDNGSVRSASNDYRVNKRRQHSYKNRHADLEQFVPDSDRSVASNSMCSVAERRKAVESRLKALTSRGQQQNLIGTVSGPQNVIQISQLTKRFDEAAEATQYLIRSPSMLEIREPDGLKAKAGSVQHLFTPALQSSLNVTKNEFLMDPPPTDRTILPPKEKEAYTECKCEVSNISVKTHILFEEKGSDDVVVDECIRGSTSRNPVVLDNFADSTITLKVNDHNYATQKSLISNAGDSSASGPEKLRNAMSLQLSEKVASSVDEIPSISIETDTNDPYRRFTPQIARSHRSTSSPTDDIVIRDESLDSAGNGFSNLKIIKVNPDDNFLHDSMLSMSEDPAAMSLILAEEVSSQVDDVLCRFRSMTRPVHEEMRSSDKQPLQRVSNVK
jgi:hypothetical protein